MTVAVTLTELRSRVRFLSDFDGSRLGQASMVASDVRLTECINAAARRLWDLLLRHRPDPYVTEQSPAPVTVANVATVALATNFYRLRQVEISDGGNYLKLNPVNLTEAWRFRTASAAPRGFRYRLAGSNTLVLVPTPTAVYTLRVYYMPTFTALVAGTDSFDGINGYEDMVIADTVVQLLLREKMPMGEWASKLNEYVKGITEAASDLDAGEPFFLSGTGPEGPDEDEWWA